MIYVVCVDPGDEQAEALPSDAIVGLVLTLSQSG